jgi:hypothetical protein
MTMAKTEKPEARFTKAQLLASKSYSGERDLLSALLSDSGEYTHAEVREILDNYKKGAVN